MTHCIQLAGVCVRVCTCARECVCIVPSVAHPYIQCDSRVSQPVVRVTLVGEGCVCSGMTGGSGLGVCAATSHQSINQHIPTLNLHFLEHSTWLDCSEASTPVLVHPPTRCCFSLPAAAKLRPGALQAVAFKFASHPRWYSCVQKKACTLQQHSPFCGVHRSNAGVVNKVPVIASPRASAPLASSTHAEVAHEPRATSGVHLPLDNKPGTQRF